VTPAEARRLEEFLTPSHIVVVATIGRSDMVERSVSPSGVEARMQQLRAQNRVIIDFMPERVLFRA
jgi:hypothetical protein